MLKINEHEALKLRNRIINWLCEYLVKSSKKGFIVGLSGGIDSTVITLLGREAAQQIGKDFLALILPIEIKKDYLDYKSALRVAQLFNIPIKEINLLSSFNQLRSLLPPPRNPVAYTNLKARLRASVIYYFANNLDYLVLGTINKGEFYIGYFPKNASAGDILPVADLLKGEIRAIGKTYGVPEELIMRKASGCIWAETAEEEWGFTEEELDRMIKIFQEKGVVGLKNIDEIPGEKVRIFIEQFKNSEHKRRFYPIFKK